MLLHSLCLHKCLISLPTLVSASTYATGTSWSVIFKQLVSTAPYGCMYLVLGSLYTSERRMQQKVDDNKQISYRFLKIPQCPLQWCYSWMTPSVPSIRLQFYVISPLLVSCKLHTDGKFSTRNKKTIQKNICKPYAFTLFSRSEKAVRQNYKNIKTASIEH